MKLSFSLSSSKPPSSRLKPPGTLTGVSDEREETTAAAGSESEFVTVFDPTVALAATAARPTIAPLPNTDSWRAPKRMKNLLPPPSEAVSSETSRFVLDISQPDASVNATFGLTLRSKGGGGGDGDDGRNPLKDTLADRSEPPAVSADQKFREDIKNLPEDRGLEEYEDISVEDFSRALLAGYGWKEGQGIGRNAKEDTKVVEPKRWAGNGGLGYTPEVGDKTGKKKRDRRPHEEEFVPVPAPVGRANGERKRVVRVTAGEHVGMKGEVVESLKGMLVLSLSRSGVEVRVGVDMVAELGSVEEEKCLRKLRELEIQVRDDKKESRKDDRRENRREKENDDKRKDRSSRDVERRGGGRETKHDDGKHHRSGDEREREPLSWLRSHIRVRIISKDYKGGKLYLKKGRVVDVVGPKMCDISVDGSGELLQGVDQEILETALPRHGGPVLVLFGRHKGIFGNLVEKDSEKEIATVRNADSHELIKLRLEQIAEYTGDPTELGY